MRHRCRMTRAEHVAWCPCVSLPHVRSLTMCRTPSKLSGSMFTLLTGQERDFAMAHAACAAQSTRLGAFELTVTSTAMANTSSLSTSPVQVPHLVGALSKAPSGWRFMKDRGLLPTSSLGFKGADGFKQLVALVSSHAACFLAVQFARELGNPVLSVSILPCRTARVCFPSRSP